MVSKSYMHVKQEILQAVEEIRKKMPEAAEYLEDHLVFDDEKESVMYTGDDRLLGRWFFRVPRE